MMNLIRYRKLESYEIRKVLNDYIGLTDYQKSKLIEIDWSPFSIIKYEKPEPVKPIWRFTILFYWIFLLMMLLLVIPIKWMLTGNRYFSAKNWHYKLYVYWTKKLGLS